MLESKPHLPIKRKHHLPTDGKLTLHTGGMNIPQWKRIKMARANAKLTQAQIAAQCGIDRAAVSQWEAQSEKNRTIPTPQNFAILASMTGAPVKWLIDGDPELCPDWAGGPHITKAPPDRITIAKFGVAEAREGYGFEVKALDAPGSCGGGRYADQAHTREPLIKEPGFFRHFKLRPEEALAVWADGDSMSDFIVDGDIVIFNKSKTTPRSGQIFLIDHPDGLRIKRLRRGIDGAWVLESNNGDKHKYPDERVAPEHAEYLKIVGEFVCRQG